MTVGKWGEDGGGEGRKREEEKEETVMREGHTR